MQCKHCRAWNEEDERRCVRCGRRLHFAAPRPMPDSYTGAAATAPALERYPVAMPAPEPAARPNPLPSQASLFRDVSGSPKVIAIPTLTPVRPVEREEISQQRRAKPRQAQRRSTAQNARSSQQQALEFYPTSDAAPSTLTPVIYCDAPVALPTHRLIAAAFDASMILLALGAFLSIFYLSGGQIELTRRTVPLFAAVVVVLALFYRVLWCLGNGDTPGMRFAGLRLVDFDGRTPDRDQRGMRQIAGILSVISAGLGLVWALVDEENLTWHDHISKTFPTIG